MRERDAVSPKEVQAVTTAATEPSLTLSRRAELLLNMALAVIVPLLFLGTLESVAYFWERSQANGEYAWELVASRRIDLHEYPTSGAGYTLMEPGSRYEWQGIPVHINSHGLRSPETWYEKQDNTVRILNLGDSVAMGWGVRLEETYGQRLEQTLNRQAGGDVRYEVINAGVPGWNPANELAYLEAEGLRYEPDLILLDVTIVNDIYGRSALEQQKRPAPIEWLRDNTHFWPFLTIQLRWLQARGDGRDRIDVIDPPTEPASYFPLDPADERWDTVWRQIAAMHDLAMTRDIPFALILFPLEYQVLDEGVPTVAQDVLKARAAEAGIPVVDVLPTFQRACREKPGGSCSPEDRYLFADVWMHPSALGHTITAAEVEAVVRELLE